MPQKRQAAVDAKAALHLYSCNKTAAFIELGHWDNMYITGDSNTVSANRHWVHAKQVSSLLTGLFKASWVMLFDFNLRTSDKFGE